VFQLNIRKRKLIEEEKELDEQHKAKRVLLINDREEALKTTKIEFESKFKVKDKELCDLRNSFEEMKALFDSTKKELAAVTQHNEQLKSMFSSLGLDCKQFSKSKREQNSTSSVSTHRQVTVSSNRNPKDMTVAELKCELRKLKVSTVGTKEILIKRLEMKIAGGC